MIRRLREAEVNTARGCGYIALTVFSLIQWAVLDRFQYMEITWRISRASYLPPTVF